MIANYTRRYSELKASELLYIDKKSKTQTFIRSSTSEYKHSP